MFPFQDQRPPTFQEKADIIRSEWDPRNPKLRLTVFGYLMENGHDAQPEDVHTIVEYICADFEEFVTTVEALESTVPEVPEEEDAFPGMFEDEDENPYGQDAGGYA